jgi:hypothetical protein
MSGPLRPCRVGGWPAPRMLTLESVALWPDRCRQRARRAMPRSVTRLTQFLSACCYLVSSKLRQGAVPAAIRQPLTRERCRAAQRRSGVCSCFRGGRSTGDIPARRTIRAGTSWRCPRCVASRYGSRTCCPQHPRLDRHPRARPAAGTTLPERPAVSGRFGVRRRRSRHVRHGQETTGITELDPDTRTRDLTTSHPGTR